MNELEHFVNWYVEYSLYFLPLPSPGKEKHGKRGNVSGNISALTI